MSDNSRYAPHGDLISPSTSPSGIYSGRWDLWFYVHTRKKKSLH